jgi:hypothetical protein
MVNQFFGHFSLTVDAILAKEAELEARKASEYESPLSAISRRGHAASHYF